MHEILTRFNNDTATKEALLSYFQDYMHSKIIERALKKENTYSLADAIIEIDNAFKQIEIDYAITVRTEDGKNHAR